MSAPPNKAARWFAFLPLVGLVAMIGLLAWGLLREKPDPDAVMLGQPASTRPAPDLKAPGTARSIAEVAASEGQPILVNFWATWCLPCEAEHPVLVAASQRGVRLVGVLYKDDADRAAQWLQQRGDPFTTLLADPTGQVMLDMGLRGVPETFVVSPEGRVLARHTGALAEADLARLEAVAAGG